MKVAYLIGPRQWQIRDEPDPTIEREDELLVRIDRAGICGSDIHYYLHGQIGQQVLSYPATLGHECAGTVIETGSAVQGLAPGTRVAIDPAIVCGQCDQCRAGRANTCRQVRFMGTPGQSPGAFAEYRALPAANCLPIPPEMSLERAMLVEPLSIGLHAVRLGEVYPAARVVILGAGPIGLSVLLCAKVSAPCAVYVTDLRDERLAVARRLGADWTGNPHASDVVREIAGYEPWGVDLVFECSGDPTCIAQAMELLTPGGTLVLVGIPVAQEVSFDIHEARTKELVFKNVRRQKGCVMPIIRLIRDRTLDPDAMLTHRFAIQQIQEAFELVANYRDGVVKAVIDISGAE